MSTSRRYYWLQLMACLILSTGSASTRSIGAETAQAGIEAYCAGDYEAAAVVDFKLDDVKN